MANQPHPSRKAVTWRLDGALVHRVKAVAAERGETVLALVTRALERELDSADTVQAREPDGATVARAFPAAEALAEAWWAPRHPGVGWADLPATVRDDYVQTAREWINAAQAVAGPSGDTVQAPEGGQP